MDAFFEECEKTGTPPTVTGLALAVGTTRKLLCEYESKDEFRNAIKRAKARCELYVLYGAIKGEIPPAVAIFLLKNFGYSDRQQIEHAGSVAAVVEVPPKAADSEEWSRKAGQQSS